MSKNDELKAAIEEVERSLAMNQGNTDQVLTGFLDEIEAMSSTEFIVMSVKVMTLGCMLAETGQPHPSAVLMSGWNEVIQTLKLRIEGGDA